MFDFSSWRSSALISQYFQSILDKQQDNCENGLVKEVKLGTNHAYLFKMEDLLTIQDQGFFSQFILEQLKSLGYKINKSANGVHHLQASVRERVAGNQLFGSIKIIEKRDELQLLITPFSDRQYQEAGDHNDLFQFLFA